MGAKESSDCVSWLALDRVRYGTRIAENIKTSLSLRILEAILRVKVGLLLLNSGSLLLVFHFRTKLDKKGRLGSGHLWERSGPRD